MAITNPTDVSGLIFWFRSALAGINGAAVSSWPDSSAEGRDLAQATASARPLVTVVSSVPVVRFDGTDDYLITSAFDSAETQPTEIFVLGKIRAIGRPNALFDGIASTDRQHVTIDNGDDLGFYAGTAVIENTTNMDTGYHVIHARFDGASSFLRLDGSAWASGNVGSHSLTGLTVGSWQGLSNFGMWDVVAIVGYAGTLTETERSDVVAYLDAQLTPPSVALAAVSATEISATITTGGSPTDHDLYVSTSVAGLYDAGNLYASSIGASPGVQSITGLSPATQYYVGVVATTADGEVYSATSTLFRYTTNFTGISYGTALPTGWSAPYANNRFALYDGDSGFGGKAMWRVRTGATEPGHEGVLWDAPNDGNADQRILAHIRFTLNGGAVVGRAAGSGNNPTYVGVFLTASGSVLLDSQIAGSYTNLDTASLGVQTNTNYWVLLELVGATARYKVWEADDDPLAANPPASWDVEYTTLAAGNQAAGRVGFSSFGPAANRYACSWLSVGTGGVDPVAPASTGTAGAAHRYWRCVGIPQSGLVLDCVELEFRATAGGADQTGSGTASASTSDASWPAAGAFDGTGDPWASNPSANAVQVQSIHYDFGSGNEVAVQQISWQSNVSPWTDHAPQKLRIQYSDDGSEFFDEWVEDSIPAWGSGGETRTFSNSAGNTAPSAPSNVAATTPADASSTLTWDAATDADSDPLQYEGEYWDGSAWQALFALQTFATLEYVIDTSAWPEASNRKARVRAHDGTAYGDWAESNTITVDHLELPGAPVISAAADSTTQATVTVGTPGSDADDHELYVAGSPTGLFDAGNLYADSLGATPTPIAVTGLVPGATYYFGLLASNGDGDTESNVVSITMPEPTESYLAVGAITDTTAQLSLVDVETLGDASEVQYEVTTAADTTFATPVVQSGTLDDTGRFAYTATGLTASTAYRARVRYRASSADPWGDWLDAVTFTTLAEPPVPDVESYWYAPDFGEPVRGTYCAIMAVDPERTVVSVEISDDDGVTWASVGTATVTTRPDDFGTPASPDSDYVEPDWWDVCFDSTGYTDGRYALRFTLDDAAVVEHAGFVIDNAENTVAEIAYGYPMVLYSGQPMQDYAFMARCATTVFGKGRWGSGSQLFGPVEPDWLAYNHGVRVSATFLNMSPGAPGYFGYIPTEFALMGIELFNGAVKINVTSRIIGRACLPNEGYGTGLARVQIGSVGFTTLCSVSGGVLTGNCCHPVVETAIDVLASCEKCGRYGGVSFVAEVYRPDPANFPNRYRVWARFPPVRHSRIGSSGGGGILSTNRTGTEPVVIDEIVDFAAPLDCGPVAFSSQSPGGFWGGYNGRFLKSFSVQLLEDQTVCGTIPEAPPPDVPEDVDDEDLIIGEPCSLKLFVYDNDRETILWETATDRLHAYPYLCDPENYGEQEIDIVAGAATIGQVEVIVIDRRQTAGDQDSGWLTDKLADGIHGRRCRLLRYISLEHGWVVIADGPASTPSMDTSYSGFRFVIRDTRETERKIPAFVEGGTTTLLPAGVLTGFGPVAATEPIIGTWKDVTSGSFGLPTSGRLSFESYWPGGTASEGEEVPTEIAFSDSVRALFLSQSSIDGFNIQRFSWPGIAILWRPAGSTDPYTEYTPSHFIVSSTPISVPLVASHPAVLDDGTEVNAIYEINWAPSGISWGNPVENEQIEIIILWTGRPSETTPMHIEGITTGALLQNLYDGVYSPRDTDTGAIIPTGIRYDADALALMTDIVRLRITEPVKDARAWSEKIIYAPTGWVPAIDNDGRVSPRSQIPPSDFTGLTEINNDITEPVPNWDAGERIVSAIEFTYPRFYHVGAFVEAGDGIAVRDITKRHISEFVLRHPEQDPVEYDGSAFGAIGDSIGGQTEEEQGEVLALLRKYYVLDRYENGAQAIRVPIMREYTHHLRAGDWVNVDLSWFPDYATRRRGMITGGQIMAIADLDCKWREALIEEAFPVLIPADYS